MLKITALLLAAGLVLAGSGLALAKSTKSTFMLLCGCGCDYMEMDVQYGSQARHMETNFGNYPTVSFSHAAYLLKHKQRDYKVNIWTISPGAKKQFLSANVTIENYYDTKPRVTNCRVSYDVKGADWANCDCGNTGGSNITVRCGSADCGCSR
ncbi:MAG: hypothetical protein KKC78_16200 [Proteobacteria bacterium]|nr:hypothetical protein [Pseudomonadota bacterium]